MSPEAKKIFNLGYLVYVIALVISFFVFEPQNIFTTILTLTLLFGVFNIVLYFTKEKKFNS